MDSIDKVNRLNLDNANVFALLRRVANTFKGSNISLTLHISLIYEIKPHCFNCMEKTIQCDDTNGQDLLQTKFKSRISWF